MIRCPSCGRRLADVEPVCARHGPVTPESVALAAGELMPPTAACEALGYRDLRPLGRGGYGVVYAAERTADGAQVALKLAPLQRTDAAQSLARELSMLRAVGAPHVPEVYDAGTIDRFCYLAMERVTSPTLADLLVELGGSAPLERFEALALAILAPLEHLHRRGIAHRDLKPENIFIPELGPARLIDFGLAQGHSRDAYGQPERAADPAAQRGGRLELAAAGGGDRSALADDAGTAEYMSPEQCDGVVDADPRSDIYSVGVLFYELLSGAPPFWGRATEVREAHRSKRPVSLARKIGCPPELDRLLMRCLAKERAQRVPDVVSLRGALQQALRAWPRVRVSPRFSSMPAAPVAAAREQRSMSLLFFESAASLAAVQALITATGGQIVQAHSARYVAAFGHDLGDNPARIAVSVAQRLRADKLSERVLIDVATVSVRQRPDGTRRIFSPVLTKADRFPSVSDPKGVTLTAAAAEVLPELEREAIAGRAERFIVVGRAGADESTSFGLEGAPFFGRDEELACLLASAERSAAQERPGLATVLGAAGYGRTHLGAVLGRALEASPSGFELIRWSLQEGAGSAGQPLRELLTFLLELPLKPADPARALRELQARLGESAGAAVAYVLGWLSADHLDVRRILSAPGALRHALARVLGEALRRRARHKPLALILDDAQLADDATLDGLEYATLPHAGIKLWVCVLARSSFLGARPVWGARAAAAERVTLGALAEKPACELARALLLPAEHIPEAALLRLVERTQGVPRLLVELVRGLKRDGYVRRAARGDAYYLATDELDKLPDLPIVQWNAIREIEALPAPLAGHARLASVLGASFRVEEVEALLSALERDKLPDDMRLDAGVGVRRLLDSGLLVRRKHTFNFRHALLRDAVYQTLPEAERTRLHRAAFEAYRTLDLPDGERLPRLAFHAAQSGQRALAAESYLTLARGYARGQAYLEAESAYSATLDNLEPSDARVIEAARGRGLMRSRLGRQESALSDLRTARERACAVGAIEQALELMLDEATVLDWMRETRQSEQLAMTVAATQHALSPLLRARVMMSLARTHHRRGEIEASISLGHEAVRLAETLGDEGYETRIIAELMLATVYAFTGKTELAQRWSEQVIGEATSRGDILHIASAYCNRAALWHCLRDVARLREDLSHTVQLSREIGEASLEWVAVYNLAESEYVLSRMSEARACAERALELATQLFGELHRDVTSCELLLARIDLYSEEHAGARAHVQNIRERIARGRAAGEREAELELNQLTLLQMVELSLSAAGAEAWQELLNRVRGLELQPMEEVELLERASLALREAGRFAEARALYEQAREVSAQKPNLISERVEARLAPLFAPAA